MFMLCPGEFEGSTYSTDVRYEVGSGATSDRAFGGPRVDV